MSVDERWVAELSFRASEGEEYASLAQSVNAEIAKAVAAAREEQREACAEFFWNETERPWMKVKEKWGGSVTLNDGKDRENAYRNVIQATPLTSTPLADRIKSLETRLDYVASHNCELNLHNNELADEIAQLKVDLDAAHAKCADISRRADELREWRLEEGKMHATENAKLRDAVKKFHAILKNAYVCDVVQNYYRNQKLTT